MDWIGRLGELASEAEVPGAVLGIWAGGEETIAPYGVLSTATGVETTADSIFQIGSITKLWTATMIAQLAGEGRLSFDDTVASLLPGVRLGREDTSDQVTVRQLLTHTSGIDGDIFTDTGRGDECVERYVELLADSDRSYPPGAAYSYCNSGFVLLGRMIEVLDDRTWDESLQARLAEPLGLSATATLPEQALLHRAAVGHKDNKPGEPVVPADSWGLARSIGPAGGITQSASDLLAFARMQLAGDGVAAAMRAEQLRLPAGTPSADALGLGVRIYEWGGRRLTGHDGSTVGQLAFLRIDPEARFAFCLLTNSPRAPRLFRELGEEVVREYLGVSMPPPPVPDRSATPDSVERHAGRYAGPSRQLDVEPYEGGLRLTWTVLGALAELMTEPVETFELLPADGSGDRFVFEERPGQPWVPVVFDRFADGTPYLFCGGRATPLSTRG